MPEWELKALAMEWAPVLERLWSSGGYDHNEYVRLRAESDANWRRMEAAGIDPAAFLLGRVDPLIQASKGAA